MKPAIGQNSARIYRVGLGSYLCAGGFTDGQSSTPAKAESLGRALARRDEIGD